MNFRLLISVALVFFANVSFAAPVLINFDGHEGRENIVTQYWPVGAVFQAGAFIGSASEIPNCYSTTISENDNYYHLPSPPGLRCEHPQNNGDTAIIIYFMDQKVPGYLESANALYAKGVSFDLSIVGSGASVSLYNTTGGFIDTINVRSAGFHRISVRKNVHKIRITASTFGAWYAIDNLAFELIKEEAPPEPAVDPNKSSGTGSPSNPPDPLGPPLANAVPVPAGGACPAGNPCNPANGNKFQIEQDYVAPGTGLQFVRTYNSNFNRDIGLGFGWTSTANARIEIGANNVVVARRADGRGESFGCPKTKGTCQGSADTQLILVKDASGYSLTYSDSINERFDVAGRLTARTYPTGLRTSYAYNAQGQISIVTGPFGHTLAFGYDAGGRIASVRDAAGQLIQYGYDAAGNLVSATFPDGSYKIYHYEDSRFIHHLTGITNENGVRFATFGYDAQGRALFTQHAVTDNAGPQEQVSFAYMSSTSTAVYDALGNSDSLQFQINLGVKNLAAKVSPRGSMTQTFDANNNVLSRVDEEGRTATYTYNSSNQLLTMTEAAGTNLARTTTYRYLSTTVDLPTQISRPSVRSGSSNIVSITYNAQKNPATITQSGYTPSGAAVSKSVTYTYNNLGQVISIDEARTDVSDITRFAYYECVTGWACGRLQSTTNAAGHVTYFNAYDANGRLLESTDPNGLKTFYTYDLRGRVTSVTRSAPLGGTQTSLYTYDRAGNLIRSVASDGVTLTYTYDAANYLRTVTDNAGNLVSYRYDQKGNRIQDAMSDSDGTLAKYIERTYDAVNRVTAINRAGAITRLIWDRVDNLVTETSPRDHNTVQNYDVLNRQVRTTYTNGSVVTYGYDSNSFLTQVVSPNNAVTQYLNDDLGNRLRETSADRGTLDYTFDNAGNIRSVTDVRGVTVAYTYDAINRVTRVDYPGTAEDITYGYDTCSYGLGRLCTVQDASGSTAFGYDAFGNVLQVQRTELGTTHTTEYTYDAANRIASITYPGGRVVMYQRDSVGRIIAVTAPINGQMTYVVSGRTYRSDGLVKSQLFANGVNEVRDHNSRGLLLNQFIGNLDTWVYGYDANDNLMDLQTIPKVNRYGYDVRDRLTTDGFITEIGTPLVRYDNNGNRTSDITGFYTYTTSTNRMASSPEGSVTLDAAGNTTNIGTRGFTYNNAGQLAESRLNGSVLASYVYNFRSLRSRKAGNTGTIVYHYDLQGRLLAETQPNGTLVRAYIWADDHPIAQIDRNSSNGQETALYLHVDHQGTPRVASDVNQRVVWRWQGSAFGAIDVNQDPDGDGVATVVNLRYPGQYADAESGLFYNWNRYYDPRTGRYITSDPIGLRGGLNTYAYVASNPLRYVDPRGLQSSAVPIPGVRPIPIPGIPSWAKNPVGFCIWALVYSKPVGEGSDIVPESCSGDGSKTCPVTPPADPADNPWPGVGEWRGKAPVGGDRGAWVNPETGEQMHPDLNHKPPVGSHWDYQDQNGDWWRVDPKTGAMTPK